MAYLLRSVRSPTFSLSSIRTNLVILEKLKFFELFEQFNKDTRRKLLRALAIAKSRIDRGAHLLQLMDLLVYGIQSCCCDRSHICERVSALISHIQQRLDFIESESQILCLQDEPDRHHRFICIFPVTRCSPNRFLQQAQPFIKPNGLNIDFRLRCYLPDSHQEPPGELRL